MRMEKKLNCGYYFNDTLRSMEQWLTRCSHCSRQYHGKAAEKQSANRYSCIYAL